MPHKINNGLLAQIMRAAMTLGAVVELTVHSGIMRFSVTVFTCKDNFVGAAMTKYTFKG